MPVYESIKNADNHIVISAENRDSVVFGWDKVGGALADKAGQGGKNIAIDGWYGIVIAVAYALFNLSDVMIQRYNRPRILMILERLER